MEFRERLYQLRKGRGISQEELAHTVGVSRQAVQKWEAGAATPDLSNLSALADYFAVSLDYLVRGIEPEKPAAPSPQQAVIQNYYRGWRYEYRSRRTLFGLPLVHINLCDRSLCRAKGVIAIGNVATGLIAIGGFSAGLLTLGGFSAGLLALGGPIMELIALGNVDTAIAGPILSILGIASIFVCFQLVGTAILQANGIVNLPIITVIIGGVTKILVNYTLVGNPKIMIFGAPVGTLSCFAVISILNLLIIKRCVPNPPRYLVALSKPLAASVVMAAAAWGSHGLLARVLNGSLTRDMAATAGAILVGVVVYVILVLALRTLTREDLEMMPGGKKLAKILHIQ